MSYNKKNERRTTISKIDRNNLKFDRLHKKAIKEFTTLTAGIYKNEFWKFRKQIENITNCLNMMYHTYLNLLINGEIETNNIDQPIEIESKKENEKDGTNI